MSRRKNTGGRMTPIWIIVAAIVIGSMGSLISNHRAAKRQEEYEEQLREKQRIRAEEEAALLAAQEAYNNLFAPLREEGYVCSETADKAVALYFELGDSEGRFVDRFIPEELKAATPADARYLVQVEYRAEAEGTYIGTTSRTAYRRYYDVLIVDLLDGFLLSKTSFAGSEPPSAIYENDETNGMGKFPEDTEVSAWIPVGIEEGFVAKAAAMKEQAYHESMLILSDNSFRCGSAADKVVIREKIYKDKVWSVCYTREFIPDEMAADAAEDVRYVVELLKTLDSVGTYFGVGGTHSAHQRRYELRIIDLTSGTVIAENDIYGGEAPQYYTEENNGIGEHPAPEEVTEWIVNSITSR